MSIITLGFHLLWECLQIPTLWVQDIWVELWGLMDLKRKQNISKDSQHEYTMVSTTTWRFQEEVIERTRVSNRGGTMAQSWVATVRGGLHKLSMVTLLARAIMFSLRLFIFRILLALRSLEFYHKRLLCCLPKNPIIIYYPSSSSYLHPPLFQSSKEGEWRPS